MLLPVVALRSHAPSHACAGPQGACAGAGSALQLRNAGPAAAGLHQGGRPASQGQLRAAPCVPHAELSVLLSLTYAEIAQQLRAACLSRYIDAGSGHDRRNQEVMKCDVCEDHCISWISKLKLLGR